MNLFVFGVGYSAERFLRTHGGAFERMSGTVRGREKARRQVVEIPRLETLVFDGSTGDPEIESQLAAADALLVSIAPGAEDPVLGRYADAIAASHIERIVYLSTIGVYGGADGGWVDESTPPSPNADRTRARVKVEDEWIALGARTGKRVFILRLAGIYGPGRNAFQNLRAGTARRIVREGHVFNRIHVDDIAGAIAACLSTNHAGGVFNVCDDEPAPPQDVVTYAAEFMKVAPPPAIPFERAAMSEMALSFWANNKRVSNRRMREELGVRLLYPTFREGLAALAKTEL